MKLIEIVILAGAHCISPSEAAEGLTEVSKVPCAVLVRQDPETAAVEIVPRSAATDPDVIAMLLKPRPERQSVEQAATVEPASIEQRIPAALHVPVPKPRDDAVIRKVRQKAPVRSRKSEARVAEASGVKKAASTRNPPDKCGSYKAVWYTNKEGRRKYRCVKA